MANPRFEHEMRSEVSALAKKIGLDEDTAFVVCYAIEAFRLDEDEAQEAISYGGGNDRGIELFFLDDAAERIVIGQSKYLKTTTRHPKPAELALLLDTINELADPQELRDAGRSDLAEAADEYHDARAKGYAVQLQFV